MFPTTARENLFTMAPISLEAQQLIARNRLGIPTEVYKPHTILSIIGGSFFMAFALGWIWFTASITGSPLLPTNLLLFHFPSIPSDDAFSRIFGIVGIVFPLFGLIFVGVGLWIILNAILNRNIRAVVCTNGVAYVMRNRADAFRWEQVLTVFHKVSVRTNTTQYQSGGTSTSTSISHTYTVHCHDGRKFTFNSTLGKVQDLAETIEVQVARYRP